MKLQIGLLTLLSTTSIAFAQEEIDLQVIQTGNSITANWAGTPLTTTPIGPDAWDVSLTSGGHSFSGGIFIPQISWVAPVGGTGYEVMTALSGTTVEYQSDVPSPEGAGPFGLGVSFIMGSDAGSGQLAFAQVFDSQPVSAPDSGASASLLGMGLLGLGLLRSKFNLAKRQ